MQLSAPGENFVTVRGLRLHYVDWGGRSERPLLMVHGLLGQARTWDPIAELLRDEYRVICLDLRGHGDSDWSKEGYPLEAFVADLHGFITELGIAPLEYVGHSLGVRIGIAYAGEYPETVRHVAFSDGGPEVTRAGALMTREFVQSMLGVRGFRNEDEALEHYRRLNPEWRPEFHALHATYELRRNWVGRLVYKADPELQWITSSASLRDLPYLWEMAARMTMPTLLMVGNKSPVLDQALLDRMLAAMPNARVARFETGHHIPREQPEEFARVLREFLATP